MPDRDVTTTTRSLRLTWVGHSTVLIELDGVRLLTDPLLRPRIAHLRRVVDPPSPASLGALDAALLSHLHFDHLDVPSLRALEPRPRLVAPAGSGDLLRRRGFAEVTELAVGDTAELGRVSVRATPADHVGKRGLLGTDALALGYVVSGSARVYFAGDTDLFDGMADLAAGLDVALLPVAGWGPRLPPGHLDPARAARALALLRPRVAVPIHWGTYLRLGLRTLGPPDAPAQEFARLAGELAPEVEVRILQVGEETLVDVPSLRRPASEGERRRGATA